MYHSPGLRRRHIQRGDYVFNTLFALVGCSTAAGLLAFEGTGDMPRIAIAAFFGVATVIFAVDLALTALPRMVVTKAANVEVCPSCATDGAYGTAVEGKWYRCPRCEHEWTPAPFGFAASTSGP